MNTPQKDNEIRAHSEAPAEGDDFEEPAVREHSQDAAEGPDFDDDGEQPDAVVATA